MEISTYEKEGIGRFKYKGQADGRATGETEYEKCTHFKVKYRGDWKVTVGQTD